MLRKGCKVIAFLVLGAMVAEINVLDKPIFAYADSVPSPNMPSQVSAYADSVSSPSMPSQVSNGLSILKQSLTDSGLTLVWGKPDNYQNISSYNIYENGAKIGNSNENGASPAQKFFDRFYQDPENSDAVKVSMHNYIINNLQPNTTYTFSVNAVDKSGNEIKAESGDHIQITTPADPQVIDVSQSPYNAVGDGKTINTKAIQSAINACPIDGEVLIPEEKTFVTGPLFLKSNMTLCVNGTLLSASTAADYGGSDSLVHSNKLQKRYSAMLNVNGTSSTPLANVRIVGDGAIDGNGWKYESPQSSDLEYGQNDLTESSESALTTIAENGILAKDEYNTALQEYKNFNHGKTYTDADAQKYAYGTRSLLISAAHVNNMYLGDGLTVTNPAGTTTGASYMKDYVINGLVAQSFNINNGDAINIARFQGATVVNCVVNSGDDDIVMNAGNATDPVSGSAWIFDNYIERGHGGVAFGSGTTSWIDNVMAEDNIMVNTADGLRCKSKPASGGGVRFVVFRDTAMKDLTNIYHGAADINTTGYQMDGCPFIFTTNYPGTTGTSAWPVFHDFNINNCSVNGALTGGIINDGTHDDNSNFSPNYNINFDNVSFKNTKEPNITYLTDSTFQNVSFDKSVQNWPTGDIANSTEIKIAKLQTKDGALAVNGKTEGSVAQNIISSNTGTLSYDVVRQPKNGSVSFTSNGSYVYTPNPGFSGADSFDYKVVSQPKTSTQGLDSNISTISVTVAKTAESNALMTVDASLANSDPTNKKYKTIGEALAAAKAMKPKSEADRITINVEPGTYQEQLIVDTPYITLEKDPNAQNGEVNLTWYYGVNYVYNNCGVNGYYDSNVDWSAASTWNNGTKTGVLTTHKAGDNVSTISYYDKSGNLHRNVAVAGGVLGAAANWGVGTTVSANANHFIARGITFQSSFNLNTVQAEIDAGVTPQPGIGKPDRASLGVNSRAVQNYSYTERSAALYVSGDESTFLNCKIKSNQDTLYLNTGSRSYFNSCDIYGGTDFIFGPGTAVFDKDNLIIEGYLDQPNYGGTCTAANTAASTLNGILFYKCTIKDRLTTTTGQSSFGRPWGADAQVTYCDTTIGYTGDGTNNGINKPIIQSAGWSDMTATASGARFYEYGSVNPAGTPVDASKRIVSVRANGIGTVLNNWQVLQYNPYYYLRGSDRWDPMNLSSSYIGLDDMLNNVSVNVPSTGTNAMLPIAPEGYQYEWVTNTPFVTISKDQNFINIVRPFYGQKNVSSTVFLYIKNKSTGAGTGISIPITINADRTTDNSYTVSGKASLNKPTTDEVDFQLTFSMNGVPLKKQIVAIPAGQQSVDYRAQYIAPGTCTMTASLLTPGYKMMEGSSESVTGTVGQTVIQDISAVQMESNTLSTSDFSESWAKPVTVGNGVITSLVTGSDSAVPTANIGARNTVYKIEKPEGTTLSKANTGVYWNLLSAVTAAGHDLTKTTTFQFSYDFMLPSISNMPVNGRSSYMDLATSLNNAPSNADVDMTRFIRDEIMPGWCQFNFYGTNGAGRGRINGNNTKFSGNSSPYNNMVNRWVTCVANVDLVNKVITTTLYDRGNKMQVLNGSAFKIYPTASSSVSQSWPSSMNLSKALYFSMFMDPSMKSTSRDIIYYVDNLSLQYSDYDSVYNVSVKSGSGSGYFNKASVASITAAPAPSGYVFDKWVSNDHAVKFASASDTTTTFTVPDQDVTVQATYKLAPFTITLQPGDVSTQVDKTVSFIVKVNTTTPDLTYQWYKDGRAIAGAVNSTYVISAAKSSDSGRYSVKITNSAGTSVISRNALLTVTVPTPISPVSPVSPAVPPVTPTRPVTPKVPPTFVSDTNSALSVDNAYTFKITSTDGKAPIFVVGTPGIFTVQFVKQSGSDYFYKITAIGPISAQTGIYVNGEKLLVATVKSAACAFVSDTNSNLSVNSAYTFKITSKNGKAPSFIVGTPGAFDVKLVKQAGSDYFIKITAVGAPGAQAGIYINGGSRFLVATVRSNPSYVKSDTTGFFKVKSGKSCVFKLTGNAKPSFIAGTGSVFKVSFVKKSGKDYFFRATAVGKAGQASGFYINHQARAAVAIIAK